MHVAIIMDGNGRWATQRGLARPAGHRAGARAVRRTVEAATRSSVVDTLTLYAFSSDNWTRPTQEVDSLMRLFKRYLVSEAARCADNGVRLTVIGRRDRLSPALVRTIEHAEKITAAGTRLNLRLAVDYSARAAILRAAEIAGAGAGKAAFEAALARATGADSTAPVDLLIRTGGERRLSDFLLWECAYAELLFVDKYWPEFDEAAFDNALRAFARRDRRFGGVPAAPVPPAALVTAANVNSLSPPLSSASK
jgi:undecaprenyl diphosphate synthase